LCHFKNEDLEVKKSKRRTGLHLYLQLVGGSADDDRTASSIAVVAHTCNKATGKLENTFLTCQQCYDDQSYEKH
jgi:hypothetical protein